MSVNAIGRKSRLRGDFVRVHLLKTPLQYKVTPLFEH